MYVCTYGYMFVVGEIILTLCTYVVRMYILLYFNAVKWPAEVPMGWNLMYGHLDVCSMHYSLDDHLSMYVRLYNLMYVCSYVCTIYVFWHITYIRMYVFSCFGEHFKCTWFLLIYIFVCILWAVLAERRRRCKDHTE